MRVVSGGALNQENDLNQEARNRGKGFPKLEDKVARVVTSELGSEGVSKQERIRTFLSSWFHGFQI